MQMEYMMNSGFLFMAYPIHFSSASEIKMPECRSIHESMQLHFIQQTCVVIFQAVTQIIIIIGLTALDILGILFQ